MGAGGHRCIGSMGDFLAILDLLPNTAWSYYLLKHPKLHSNYSAGLRAMHHLPPYGGTRWWRAAPNSGLPRPTPSARLRLDACKARRHSRCRCLSLISRLRVCRWCQRGHLREGGEYEPGRVAGLQAGAGERTLPRSGRHPPFAAPRSLKLCRSQQRR